MAPKYATVAVLVFYVELEAFFIVGLEPCEDEDVGLSASAVPRDIASYNFQSDNEIKNMMLTSSDVATVISSYEKTIGMPIIF